MGSPSTMSVGGRRTRSSNTNVKPPRAPGDVEYGPEDEVERMRNQLMMSASEITTRKRSKPRGNAGFANVYATNNRPLRTLQQQQQQHQQPHDIAPPLINNGSTTSTNDSLPTSDGEVEATEKSKTRPRATHKGKNRSPHAPRIRLDNPPRLFAPLQPPARPPKPVLRPKAQLFPPQTRGTASMERTASDGLLRGFSKANPHSASIPSKRHTFNAETHSNKEPHSFENVLGGRGSR